MLVDYSDSDSDSGSGSGSGSEPDPNRDPKPQPGDDQQQHLDQIQPPNKKRRTAGPAPGPGSVVPPPPPPPSFHALYATNVRGAVSDDPSLHGGRARQTGHVQGNWPTHIFLQWIPATDQVRKLEHIIEACRRCRSSRDGGCGDDIPAVPVIHSLLRSELNVPLPLHISLSAPLALKTEQKDDVAAAVEAAVSSCSSGARAFTVCPTRLCWVSNLERSRSFLVLKLTRPKNDDLNQLLKACNSTVASFGLNTLYSEISPSEEDAFHISIAWALGDVSKLNLPVPVISRKSPGSLSGSGSTCQADNVYRHVEQEGQEKDVDDDGGADDDVDDDSVDDDDSGHDDITSLKISFHTVKLKIGNVVKDIILLSSPDR